VLEFGYELDFIFKLYETLSWMWSKSLDCYLQSLGKVSLDKKIKNMYYIAYFPTNDKNLICLLIYLVDNTKAPLSKFVFFWKVIGGLN
jgi:hypothetical protein